MAPRTRVWPPTPVVYFSLSVRVRSMSFTYMRYCCSRPLDQEPQERRCQRRRYSHQQLGRWGRSSKCIYISHIEMGMLAHTTRWGMQVCPCMWKTKWQFVSKGVPALKYCKTRLSSAGILEAIRKYLLSEAILLNSFQYLIQQMSNNDTRKIINWWTQVGWQVIGRGISMRSTGRSEV